jgi:hypothetical protein
MADLLKRNLQRQTRENKNDTRAIGIEDNESRGAPRGLRQERGRDSKLRPRRNVVCGGSGQARIT